MTEPAAFTALDVLRARLATHRAAGRVAAAAECRRCIEAIKAAMKALAVAKPLDI